MKPQRLGMFLWLCVCNLNFYSTLNFKLTVHPHEQIP
jgi:hypothetical protein